MSSGPRGSKRPRRGRSAPSPTRAKILITANNKESDFEVKNSDGKIDTTNSEKQVTSENNTVNSDTISKKTIADNTMDTNSASGGASQVPKTKLSELFINKPSTSSAPHPNIPLRNRFEVLSSDEEEDEISTNHKKPPPIVFHQKTADHQKYIETIQQEIKKGFHVKYTANNTNLYIYDLEEYKRYMGLIRMDEDLKYHTYTPKSEKRHAFILRGMDMSINTDVIKTELQNMYKLKVHEIYKLKNTARNLYLIVMDGDVTIKNLNKEVIYIYHTRVTWERRRNAPEIIQCRRCQKWSHATANCYDTPKCLKCAGSHWTKACDKVKREDQTTTVNIKCANCAGAHLAFDRACPIYIRKLQQKDASARPPKQITPRYIPAPLPTSNPWAKPQAPTTGFQINQHSFPQLPTRTLPQQSTQLPIPQTQAQAPPQQQTTRGNSGISGINELASEFQKLDKLINVNHMLQLVRELTQQLSNCNNELDKFQIFYNFCTTKFNGQGQP